MVLEAQQDVTAEVSARVLIVDDDPSNLMLVEAQLKREPFEVMTVSNGHACLEYAQSDNPPEVILLDVMMPDMDGFETCRRLKNNPATANIPVIMVTALTDVEDRVKGLRSGADEFISRPLNREMMIVRIRALVGLKRAREQVEEDRRKYSAILEQSSDAVIVVDLKGVVTIFNQAAERIFQLDKVRVLDQVVFENAGLSDLLPLLEEPEEQEEAQGQSSYEIRTPYGLILSAGMTFIEQIGHVIVVQDITVRIEAEEREKEALRMTLSRYISPRLLESFVHDPGTLFEQTIEETVVLFADLRNSTKMIVKIGPSESVLVLNEFFEAMTEIVHQHEGIIFDLIGDELEIGFNVPLPQADAAERALMTALTMHQRFVHLRQDWYERYGIDLGLGVGMDRGKVVVGNIGSEARMNLAMIGQAVNSAHRLVDLAEDGQILVSGSVMRSAEKNQKLVAPYKLIGAVTVKGIETPVDVYRSTIARTALG